MGQLRLDHVHGFDDYLFNFTPYHCGILPKYFTVAFTNQLAFENVFKSQFVLCAVEFFIVFI